MTNLHKSSGNRGKHTYRMFAIYSWYSIRYSYSCKEKKIHFLSKFLVLSLSDKAKSLLFLLRFNVPRYRRNTSAMPATSFGSKSPKCEDQRNTTLTKWCACFPICFSARRKWKCSLRRQSFGTKIPILYQYINDEKLRCRLCTESM